MVEVRYSIYFSKHVPRFGGVVEVEVDPSNFNLLHGGAREIGSRENFLQDLEPLPRWGVW